MRSLQQSCRRNGKLLLIDVILHLVGLDDVAKVGVDYSCFVGTWCKREVAWPAGMVVTNLSKQEKKYILAIVRTAIDI